MSLISSFPPKKDRQRTTQEVFDWKIDSKIKNRDELFKKLKQYYTLKQIFVMWQDINCK